MLLLQHRNKANFCDHAHLDALPNHHLTNRMDSFVPLLLAIKALAFFSIAHFVAPKSLFSFLASLVCSTFSAEPAPFFKLFVSVSSTTKFVTCPDYHFVLTLFSLFHLFFLPHILMYTEVILHSFSLLYSQAAK